MYIFRIDQDVAYCDELLAMRKYFQETLLREANFCENLKKFFEIKNITEEANNHITNSNLLAAIEKYICEIELN